ncbi:MAG: amidohydrolase family protein [Chloroflexota bacterium]
MIIDVHTHIFPPEIKKDRARYVTLDPCFAELYSSPRAKLITADELIARMDEAGIDMSVVLNIGWGSHKLCQKTNDYILESVARYPRRLIGFGAVLPRLGDTAAKEAERCARGGMKGIGELRPDPELDFEDKEALDPFTEVMKRCNLTLLTHASEPVGHDYPGKGKLTPAVLYRMIEHLPGINIICAHWGGGLPFYALMPEVKTALARTYFDTAASPYLYRPEIYEQVIRLVGKEKILFGSDYPVISQERVLGETKSIALDEETRDLILSGNAVRLFGIKE